MDLGGLEQVLPAHHMGHALGGIIHRDRKVIRGGHVLAGDDKIADAVDQIISGDVDPPMSAVRPLAGFVKSGTDPRRGGPGGAFGGGFDGAGDVQPKRAVARAGPVGGHLAAAGAGIDQTVGPEPGGAFLRGRGRLLDIAAAACAGIEQPHRPQPVQCRVIGRLAGGLPHHRAAPAEPQPVQVVIDLVFPMRPAAAAVDILDPQQERALAGLGHVKAQQRRIGMAQMQRAGGGRGKAGCECHVFART